MVAANPKKKDPPNFDARGGLVEIAVRREPLVTIKPRLLRGIDEVEGGLLNALRGLCAGELRWPLFLWGDEGRGKTLAALCLYDKVIDARWYDVDRICQALVTQNEYVWEIIRDTQLVILDEVGGRDQVSSVDADAVKKFADIREQYAGRVSVYISNHPPDTIKKVYGRRIFSRLCCGTIYQVTGPDRRMA